MPTDEQDHIFDRYELWPDSERIPSCELLAQFACTRKCVSKLGGGLGVNMAFFLWSSIQQLLRGDTESKYSVRGRFSSSEISIAASHWLARSFSGLELI